MSPSHLYVINGGGAGLCCPMQARLRGCAEGACMLLSHLLLQQQLAVLLLQDLQLQAQADSSMIC